MYKKYLEKKPKPKKRFQYGFGKEDPIISILNYPKDEYERGGLKGEVTLNLEYPNRYKVDCLDRHFKFGKDYLLRTVPYMLPKDSSEPEFDESDILSDPDCGDDDVFLNQRELYDLLPHRRPPIPQLIVSSPTEPPPAPSDSPYTVLTGMHDIDPKYQLHPWRPYDYCLSPNVKAKDALIFAFPYLIKPAEEWDEYEEDEDEEEAEEEKVNDNVEEVAVEEKEEFEGDDDDDDEEEYSSETSYSPQSSPSPPPVHSPPRSSSEPNLPSTSGPSVAQQNERPLDFAEYKRRLELIFGRVI